MRRLALLPALALLLALPACAEDAPTDAVPSIEEDLVRPTAGGKTDTGYLSNLAAELEGTFTSIVVIDVSAKTVEERDEELKRLSAGGWAASTPINRQVKYAKNQINAAALHMNLSASEAVVTSAILTDEGFIQLTYETTVETIVTNEELAKEGTNLEAVLAASYDAIVPDDPTKMASAIGAACLEEGHDSASDYNYFYYYAPEREGCEAAMEAAGVGRVTASLTVRNLAPAKTVYPEYDKLTEDGRVDVALFFGAADHDWEPGQWDWGTSARDKVVSALKSRGFSKVAAHDGDGDLYTRTKAGLDERVTVIGPEVLKLLKDDADGLFQRVVSTSEIIFYNGHSFYGSLSVLDDEALYPGHYQIFFMNSCWSYEYYTKQIFKHNATDEDPTGWALADVVNDTESGWFHNMADESRILLTNLLAGAESGGIDGDRYYTWDRIIGAMNDHAVRSYELKNSKSHEIYGVSGVTTNAFDPEVEVVEPEPQPTAPRFTSEPAATIPDDDEVGLTDTLTVPADSGLAGKVLVEVTIAHTFVGDLTVTLTHEGETLILHDGAGAESDDLALKVETLAFAGRPAEGEWVLSVVDAANLDEGTLTSWAVTLLPAE